MISVDVLGSYNFSYAYSPTGNILTQTDPDTGGIVTNTYDNANRLLTSEELSGITTYTYDANGNQLTIEEPGGSITTNTWNGENRLVQVEHSDLSKAMYKYDADGHRVEKDDDGVDITRFVYDGNNVLQEKDDLGVVEADFTYIPAVYAKVISQHRDAQTSIYHFDATASTMALTDTSNVVTDEYVVDAWGEVRSSTGSTANSQIYKGQWLSYYNDPHLGPETSMYSVGHRIYSAKQRRFLSDDPSESCLPRHSVFFCASSRHLGPTFTSSLTESMSAHKFGSLLSEWVNDSEKWRRITGRGDITASRMVSCGFQFSDSRVRCADHFGVGMIR